MNGCILQQLIWKSLLKNGEQRYNIINIINSNPQLEEALEIWQNDGKDIIIEVDGNRFNNEDFRHIQNMNDIIKGSGELGEFELGNLKITINSLKTYERDLIVCKK